jgi:hypothetical protein
MKQSMGKWFNLDEHLIDKELEDILKYSAQILFDIYKTYFPWEISLSENESFVKDESAKAFLKFVTDYDLCPVLVSKGAAFSIFQHESMGNEELTELYISILQNVEICNLGKENNIYPFGKYFTFIKFIKAICSIANKGYDSNLMELELSYYEKICLTLERMEQSQGFLNIQQKTAKTCSKKTTCLIPQEIMGQIKQNFKTKKEAVKINYNFEYQDYILYTYGSELSLIFKYYCSFGDSMNTVYMKSNKFAKFLNEANLITKVNGGLGIKMNEIDIIFFKLISLQENNISDKRTTVNSYAKIDYLTFINAIEMIADHCTSTDKKNIIDTMFVNNIIPLIKKFIKKTNELSISQIEDADYVKLKSVLAKSLLPLYRVYMNQTETINFNTLFQ